MFIVYMLLCADQSIYTGVTSDLEGRILKHKEAHYPNSYTAKRLPVELIWQEHHTYWTTAFDREKQIKRWSLKKKLALAYGNLQQLSEHSKKKFDTRKDESIKNDDS